MAPKRKPPAAKKPASPAPSVPEEASAHKPWCSTRGHPSSDSVNPIATPADDSTQPIPEDIPDVQGSALAESSQDDGHTKHGYSTRTTNKGHRPAFAVGLAKHFKADIASEAKAKKASEDAARAQKKAEQDTAEATLDLQRDAVAVLERQRAEDDAEEACYFNTDPPLGDQSNPGDEPSTDTAKDGHLAPRLPVSLLKPDLPSFLDDRYSDSESGGDLFEARSHAQDVVALPRKQPARGVAKTTTRSAPASPPRSIDDHVSDSRDEDYQDDPQVELEEDAQEGDAEDEMVYEQSAKVHPKLSYAEKKAQKKKDVRDDLYKRRKRAGSGSPNGQVQPPAKRPCGTKDSIIETSKSSKKSGKGDDAFSVSWRERYASEAHTSKVSAAMPSRTPAPRSYAAAARADNKRRDHDKGDENSSDVEIIGGFTDQQVHVDRTFAILQKHKKAALAAAQKPLDFSEVSQSEDYSAGKRKSVSTKNSKASPKKKVQSDDEDSPTAAESTKKYDNLPDWVKPEVRTLVVPSLKECVGMQDEGPWLLDLPNKHTFLERLQALIDDVFPECHHKLTVKDPIHDWVHLHSKTAGKIAIILVKAEITMRRADTTLSAYDCSDRGVNTWLQDTAKPGGEAIWGCPNIKHWMSTSIRPVLLLWQLRR
ncbi:hypothetical protein TRAPUB_5761 [Trametes pubescens]|uniref:Uncharacterized protein n=1 Tax=Trametes pubescens TaxID=154538 RepID=A0A1M2V7N6_TRAPU|nr:hypothetical protein TRAPUB_5761 [Trametes pubescens]